MSVRRLGQWIIAASAGAYLSPAASAWDPAGHMLVGQIAWEYTSPSARERVQALVGTLESAYNEGQPYNFVTAGCWMDDMRSKPGYAWGKWHYVTIPWTADGVAFQLPSPPHIVSALDEALQALKTPGVSSQKVAEAVAIIIHLVGDIHQPMHATDRGDRGGNGVLVAGVPFTDLWKGTVPNLHAFWDAAFRFDAGLDEKVTQVWLAPLLSKRPNLPGEGIIATEAAKIVAEYPKETLSELSAVQGSESWARESHIIGCLEAYPTGSEASDHTATAIAPDFAQKARRTATKRVAIAGYRLATLLNQLFAE